MYSLVYIMPPMPSEYVCFWSPAHINLFWNLNIMNITNIFLPDLTVCSLVDRNQHFRGTCCLSEDGDSVFFCNIHTNLPCDPKRS